MPNIPFAIIIAPLLFAGALYLIYRGLQGRDVTFNLKLGPGDESNKVLNRLYAVAWLLVLTLVIYVLLGGHLSGYKTIKFYVDLLKIFGVMLVLAVIRYFLYRNKNQ